MACVARCDALAFCVSATIMELFYFGVPVMSETTADDALGYRLLTDCQHDFPLCATPFAELAKRLGVSEGEALGRLSRLRREGRIARVGAVFAPKRIGASTLVAVAVPAADLTAVIECVGRFPEVNHLVVREHRFNLWFVVTAGGEGRLEAALSAIETACMLPLLRLPLLGDLRHPGDSPELAEDKAGICGVPRPADPLDEIGRRLVMVLQEGLPLLARPFSVLASRVGCDEGEVISRIRNWLTVGVIKRFGVVLRAAGKSNDAQALWVLDVPDSEVPDVARRLAGDAGPVLCYLRPRVLPDWPYNLFCTMSGSSRAVITDAIAAARSGFGLEAYPEAVLHDLGYTPLALSGGQSA